MGQVQHILTMANLILKLYPPPYSTCVLGLWVSFHFELWEGWSNCEWGVFGGPGGWPPGGDCKGQRNFFTHFRQKLLNTHTKLLRKTWLGTEKNAFENERTKQTNKQTKQKQKQKQNKKTKQKNKQKTNNNNKQTNKQTKKTLMTTLSAHQKSYAPLSAH